MCGWTHRLSLALLVLIALSVRLQGQWMTVVAADGTGDFATVAEAVRSLPPGEDRKVIFIKNGVYTEKIRLTRSNVTLRGESREGTILQFNQKSDDFTKNPDSIGRAVINIEADDIIIEGMTIVNTNPEIGPHAFTILGRGTRTVILNCNVWSKGADTVSLWNKEEGMYYHADCDFRGSVDFVCPRGWCFIRDSKFYEERRSAAIWHDGSFAEDQKFVIRNSQFDGVDSFYLGRHHWDAQFYLIDCTFSARMNENPIFRKTYPEEPARDRPFNWGPRYYFYNCHKTGGDYAWHADNLSTADPTLKPESITPEWTFAGKWDPEAQNQPQINGHDIEGHNLTLTFSEPVSAFGRPVLKGKRGRKFTYRSGSGGLTLTFTANKPFTEADLNNLKMIGKERIVASAASAVERPVRLSFGRN